tara:strand:+ start:2189 stop:3193 length:1005 start_codon:yes stop_codon:yes gene_type:complete
MNATIVPEKTRHFPVLLDELISIITPQNGGTFIDCTFGQGGYSKKILQFPKTKVIAIDRDKSSLPYAENLKKKYKSRFFFYNIKFSEIDTIIQKEKIKGIIFDLGFSLSQIKDSSKGLSFKDKGKLNMRVGYNNFSADDAIKKLSQKELEMIFKFFGNENKSKIISKKIVYERNKKNIKTEDLVKIINYSKKNFTKIDKSTKIFQALRIFVNNEVSQLIYTLDKVSNIICRDGVLATVSFHSVEDRICKYFFRGLTHYKSISRYMPDNKKSKLSFDLVNKKPITPSIRETKKNPPSRSAKLRAVIRKDNRRVDNKFIYEKFGNLLNVEKIGNKL